MAGSSSSARTASGDDRTVRRRVHPGHPLGAPRLRDGVPHAAGRDLAHRRLQARLTPVDGRRTDLSRIGALADGDRHPSSCSSDSTNAEEPGFTRSERSVGESLREIFAEHPGHRVIVACFASHIHRIQQLTDAAIRTAAGLRCSAARRCVRWCSRDQLELFVDGARQVTRSRSKRSTAYPR